MVWKKLSGSVEADIFEYRTRVGFGRRESSADPYPLNQIELQDPQLGLVT